MTINNSTTSPLLSINSAYTDQPSTYALNIAVDGTIAVTYADRVSDVVAFVKLLHPQIAAIVIGTGDCACDNVITAACRQAGVCIE